MTNTDTTSDSADPTPPPSPWLPPEGRSGGKQRVRPVGKRLGALPGRYARWYWRGQVAQWNALKTTVYGNLLLLVVGIGLPIIAVIGAHDLISVASADSTTTGHIVSISCGKGLHGPSCEGDVSYYVNGSTYQWHGNLDYGHAVGDPITTHYDSRHPARSTGVAGATGWFGGIFLIVLGLGALVFDAWNGRRLWRHLNRRSTQQPQEPLV